MTEYIDYNKFENKKVFFEDNSKKDAFAYLLSISSILFITSGAFYFLG